ncbi:MAG: DUF554 domain-containing protein [Firmicutes bacterium HGW-Firmicutes-9]|nr:MAG: DUF554 domain-containing protein [Firmicutes bacterium HGW-Firmicutes-9]
MLGTIVNAIAILVGGAIGLLLKKGIPERVSGGIMQGLGLVVIYIGISGMLKGQNPLIATISIVIGGVIGMIFDFDGRFNRFVNGLEQKLAVKGDDGSRFSEAFITTTLLYCVGAMAVVGSLNSGLTGNHEVLYTKSILDGVSAVVFASTLGAGVLLSAVPLFLYQGAITLMAQFLAPVLSDAAVAEMTCVGSLLILAIGLNLLKVTKIKVLDFILAIFLPIALVLFM